MLGWYWVLCIASLFLGFVFLLFLYFNLEKRLIRLERIVAFDKLNELSASIEKEMKNV